MNLPEQLLFSSIGIIFTILGILALFKPEKFNKYNLEDAKKGYNFYKNIPVIKNFATADFWYARNYEGKLFSKIWGTLATCLGILFIFASFYYFILHFPQSSIFIQGDSNTIGANVYLDNKLKGHMAEDANKNIIFAQGEGFDLNHRPNYPDDSVPIPAGLRKIDIKIITKSGETYTYTATNSEDVTYNVYKIKDFKREK